jgi:hypothetical protein
MIVALTMLLCGSGTVRADDCGYTFWAGTEYLLYRIRNEPIPTLLTTGNPLDPFPGALGQPGTRTLLGNEIDYGNFNGIRENLGVWVTDELGFEASGFFLFQNTFRLSAGSDAAGNPPLYVPAFRTDLGREGSFTISDPVQQLAGSINISSSSQFWGAEFNGLWSVMHCDDFAMAFLCGFRYLNLQEDIDIGANLNDPVLNIQDSISESFRTRNQFYGGQVGVKFGLHGDRVFLDVVGKVALGDTHQVVTINGTTTQSGPGTSAMNPAGTFAGGILTAPTNIGEQTRNAFAVVPQAGIKLGICLFHGVWATAGYDIIYWSSVVRPGQQIDHNVNQTQLLGNPLVGPAAPLPQFVRSDFWAQGLSVGIEFRY